MGGENESFKVWKSGFMRFAQTHKSDLKCYGLFVVIIASWCGLSIIASIPFCIVFVNLFSNVVGGMIMGIFVGIVVGFVALFGVCVLMMAVRIIITEVIRICKGLSKSIQEAKDNVELTNLHSSEESTGMFV